MPAVKSISEATARKNKNLAYLHLIKALSVLAILFFIMHFLTNNGSIILLAAGVFEAVSAIVFYGILKHRLGATHHGLVITKKDIEADYQAQQPENVSESEDEQQA